MSGSALAWIEALYSKFVICNLSFSNFEACVKAVLDHPSHWNNASSRLLNLQQGSLSVVDDSGNLSLVSRWNDAAQHGVFLQGLSERLRDKLAAREKPADLPSLVSVTNRLEKRLHKTWQEKLIYSFSPARLKPSSASIPSGTARPTPALSAEEPIQLGHACLLHEDWHSQISARGCLYYSKTGLFYFSPKRKGLSVKVGLLMSQVPVQQPYSTSQLLILITLRGGAIPSSPDRLRQRRQLYGHRAG